MARLPGTSARGNTGTPWVTSLCVLPVGEGGQLMAWATQTARQSHGGVAISEHKRVVAWQMAGRHEFLQDQGWYISDMVQVWQEPMGGATKRGDGSWPIAPTL